jgi:hypothetical protein
MGLLPDAFNWRRKSSPGGGKKMNAHCPWSLAICPLPQDWKLFRLHLPC